MLELYDLEKKRIGQDLHDGIGQQLTGISLMSRALEHRLREQGNPAADELRQLSVLVDEVIQRVRNVVAGMAPSEIQDQDAATALEQLCQHIEALYHIRCVFDDRLAATEPIMNPDVVKHLYFIAAEAIHNAIRHGEADQIEVCFRHGTGPHQAELVIQDNGNGGPEGFPASVAGVGLHGMRFRAEALDGSLSIEQHSDRSVTVTCSFSLFPSA